MRVSQIGAHKVEDRKHQVSAEYRQRLRFTDEEIRHEALKRRYNREGNAITEQVINGMLTIDCERREHFCTVVDLMEFP